MTEAAGSKRSDQPLQPHLEILGEAVRPRRRLEQVEHTETDELAVAAHAGRADGGAAALEQIAAHHELDVLHPFEQPIRAVVHAHLDLHAGDLRVGEVRRDGVQHLRVEASVGVDHTHDHPVQVPSGEARSQLAVGVVQRLALALTRCGPGAAMQQHLG